MDLSKAAFRALLLLCIAVTGFVGGQSSSLFGRRVKKNAILLKLEPTSHVVSKRQVPWYKECPSCGQSTKTEPNEAGTGEKDIPIYRYDAFKSSLFNKMRSDARCKDAPSVSVCKILRKAARGFRG